MLNDVDDALAHYGVLGMHWGIRRSIEREKKKISKADTKWKKAASKGKGWSLDYDEMANAMNSGELDRINDDPRFRGQDVKSEGPLRDAYHAAVQDAATRLLNAASTDRLGTSPSGAVYVDWVWPDGPTGFPVMRVIDNRVAAHADTPEDASTTTLQLEFDDLGHILKIAVPKVVSELVQSDLTMDEIIDSLTDEEAEEVLAHYGVLGMHWGIRKARNVARNDTRNTRKALSSLDNDELRATVERMRLEKQYREIADTSVPTQVVRLISKHGGTIVASAAAATASHLVRRELNRRYPNTGAADAIAKAKKALEDAT